MKIFYLLLFAMISIPSFSQGKEGVIKVRKPLNSTPMISGIAGGEIDASLLCVGEGIVINKNIKVISFVMIVENGSRDYNIKHNGNTLNKEACDILALLRSGAEVFINEIAVIDNKGRESLTTPMRFTLK